MSIMHRYEARVLSHKEQIIQVTDMMSRQDPLVFNKLQIDSFVESPEKIPSKLHSCFVRGTGDLHELISIFHRAKWEFDRP